jgi:hypothetical protein
MLFYPDPVRNQELLLHQLREWNAVPKPHPFKRFFTKGTQINKGVDKAFNAAMIAEDKAHRVGSVALYHSTAPDIYAKNFIDTASKKLELEVKGKKADSGMLLLRDPEKHLSYEKENVLRKRFLKEGAWDSGDGEHLLSCNVGLTGNTSDPTHTPKGEFGGTIGPGESTVKYFLKKLNISKPKSFPIAPRVDDKLLDNQLKLAQKELEAAAQKFNQKSNTGVLLQLLLKDDKLVRKVLYNALPGGKNAGDGGLFRKSLVHGKQVSEPTAILKAIKTEPSAFQTPQRIYNKREKSLYGSDHNPFEECLDTQQMRVALTGDLLLDMNNPEVSKNFTVNAYSADDKNLQEFQSDVRSIMDKVKYNYQKQKGRPFKISHY